MTDAEPKTLGVLERLIVAGSVAARVRAMSKRKVHVVHKDGTVDVEELHVVQAKILARAEVEVSSDPMWLARNQKVCVGFEGPCPRAAKCEDRVRTDRAIGDRLRRSGQVLWRCQSCTLHKANASMTPEQRRERSRKGLQAAAAASAALTPEQRSEKMRKANASMTLEQRAQHIERLRKANAALTPEQRSENARKAAARLTPEQRSENGRKAAARLTPEQRSENARKANAALTPEQRSENGRKAAARLTPEQRSEKARRAVAAREAKKDKVP